MQLFRRLADNVFFKIILALVAVSFVLFGISGFILGTPNSWVAKIGGKNISYSTFNRALQGDREIVLSSSKSEETLKYIDSEKFKSDVLGRLVNKIMIEKLNDDFGVHASKKIILEAVARDPSFKNQDGKFDHNKFKQFLAKNGFNEERYINEISNDITATMILQSLAMAAPLNYNAILETENFKQEKRSADVITITAKNVTNVAKASDEEMQKFFAENKARYALPETRKISYIHFSKKDFAKDLQISDKEIFEEYEKNKDQFTKPETRNFYHIVFDKEEDAKTFASKLDAASNAKVEFAKLAKEMANKDLKAITIGQISQKDLVPQLSDNIFKLSLNQHSNVLQSSLGYHVFLLNEIKQPQLIPFSEVKAGLKQKVAAGREEKIVQEKISAIDDALLTSNSLSEVAKKFNLKINQVPVKIDQAGQSEKGAQVPEMKLLDGFAENAFALKKDQVSKIFYAKNSDGYYALKVEEISPAHERELSEVKSQIASDLVQTKRHEALINLAKKVSEELKANPNSIAQIAAKYQLKLEKNREFPRSFYVNFQGRQIPYQNKFLEELFKIKIGQATSVVALSTDELVAGVLRDVKKYATDPAQFEQAKKQADESFRNEVMQEYNSYLLKKYPVKVNDKLFGKKDESN